MLRERARQLEREEKARTAVAEERGRIARELHDVVAHSVSVMVTTRTLRGAAIRGAEPGQIGVWRQAIYKNTRTRLSVVQGESCDQLHGWVGGQYLHLGR
jgi:signal transduction histidine kinase